ncbi:Uncharacterised protein [Mycobacterium tuberculosis]|nr:Uncharacterised protein [Mycobacterium tuberculosis]
MTTNTSSGMPRSALPIIAEISRPIIIETTVTATTATATSTLGQGNITD